jgi:DnaJ-class molecular chaperone
MTEQDYYNLLGVPRNADAKEIRDAFRQKALEFHPDRNPGDESAASKMKAINEAYAVLSNPQKRQEYDSLYRSYGGSAHQHFRQTYSEQDIFKHSDVHQVFEEIAKSFGLRGFEDIFKEFYGQSNQRFEFRRPGVYAKGFVFRGSRHRQRRMSAPGAGLLGRLAQKMLQSMLGRQLPQKGKDLHDVIRLKPEFARKGGPFAYYLSQRNKKLVVKIPPNVRNDQRIRLAGMGQPGLNGGYSGDLFLKIKIHQPFLERVKSLIAPLK